MNPRIGDLVQDVEEGRLLVRPAFQRRLVWTNDDKEFFIDTVLKKFPFPEVFVATGALDRKSAKRQRWLVDGQQRITTLKDYIRGSPDLLYRKIPRYDALPEDEQTSFLDSEVAVRDLGTIDTPRLMEIFKRINSTDYALTTMETLNAMFRGKYKQYCEELSRQRFFKDHKVFPAAYEKRMHDVAFCVILVTTILSGYYHRAEKNEEYLERYNDDFPQQDKMQVSLDRVFDFVERCGFETKSRVWKQTDLFTLLVEIHSALVVENLPIMSEAVGLAVTDFFHQVNSLFSEKKLLTETEASNSGGDVFRYLKASTKASNDKYSRVQRAEIISSLIRSTLEQSRKGAASSTDGRTRRGKKS